MTALLAEYESLRKEIEWLIDHGMKYQNFAISLVAALLAGIGWMNKEVPIVVLPTLLVAPVLFSLLGFLYFREHEEIHLVAAYLRDCIHPKIRMLVGDETIWKWEEFKSLRTQELSPPGIILLLRTMLFVVPSAASLVAAAFVIVGKAQHQTVQHYGCFVFLIWGFCYVFDVSIVVMLVVRILRGRDLSKRFSGDRQVPDSLAN